METRSKAGNKDITFIGLGCWRFGEEEEPAITDNPGKSYWGGQSRKDSLKTIDAALRGGITHFDTAQGYGMGKSEQLTGQRLRKVRSNIVIATKIMTDRFSCTNIEKKVNLSLKRLNTDYIDIIYIHWPSDPDTIKITMDSLEKIRMTGKISCIGVSNFSVSDMKFAMQGGNIDFHQTGYNFIWRESEKEIIPFCLKNNINVIGYSFFAQGLLTSQSLKQTGKHLNDRRKDLIFFKNGNRIILEDTISSLRIISEETGYTIPQLLIGWAKSKPWLKSILIGGRNRLQAEKAIEADRCRPDRKLLEKLENLSRNAVFDTGEHRNIFNHSFES